MAGRGARPQYASTAQGVLQSCADPFECFVTAAGIPQIDLTALEGGGEGRGQGERHHRAAQLHAIESMSNTVEDGGAVAGGGTQSNTDGLVTAPVQSEGEFYLSDGLTSGDQARREVANECTDHEEQGLKFCDRRRQILAEAREVILSPRTQGGGARVTARPSMSGDDAWAEPTANGRGRQGGELAYGLNPHAVEQGVVRSGELERVQRQGCHGVRMLSSRDHVRALPPASQRQRSDGVVSDDHVCAMPQLIHAYPDPFDQCALLTCTALRSSRDLGHNRVWRECGDVG